MHGFLYKYLFLFFFLFFFGFSETHPKARRRNTCPLQSIALSPRSENASPVLYSDFRYGSSTIFNRASSLGPKLRTDSLCNYRNAILLIFISYRRTILFHFGPYINIYLQFIFVLSKRKRTSDGVIHDQKIIIN